VRGAKYSFVNSNRLQERLRELDIKYGYIPELAPTSDIRMLQKEIDLEKGELKSKRQELGKVFIIEFKNKVLQNFDFSSFFEKLENINANRIALFCVEEYPAACHRSLVAEKIFNTYHYQITHL
jgi:uncharacterized protein (DUF488 family)